MSTKIKGVLFDKDGTLFKYGDTWQIWCDRVIQALAGEDLALRKRLADGCGYDIEKKIFTPGSLVVNASAHEINQAWAEIHPALDYKQIEAIGVEKLQNLPVIPVCDLSKMLGSLKALGMMVGCATNDFESSAKTQLSEAEIGEHFDFICGFDSGFGAKPGPGMLQAFAEKCGLKASEVAMVGDSTHDLHCGRSAGAALCVGVLTGPAKAQDIQDYADIVLGSVELLPEYLERSTAKLQ
jgi:phosphoglycolate phosphatase